MENKQSFAARSNHVSLALQSRSNERCASTKGLVFELGPDKSRQGLCLLTEKKHILNFESKNMVVIFITRLNTCVIFKVLACVDIMTTMTAETAVRSQY